MERRNTVREEDEVKVTRPRIPTSSTSSEEIRAGAVSAYVGSSKQFRKGACGNEDRVCLSKIKLIYDSKEIDMMFLGLFDGHGGGGKASEFVCENISKTFQAIFSETNEPSIEEAVCKALEKSFDRVDSDFHRKVKQEALKASIGKKDARSNCCRYFNEDPCCCSNPPIPANEGSTGTVVIVTQDAIYSANVGDSDAFILCGGGGEDKNNQSSDDENALSSPSSASTCPNSDTEDTTVSSKRLKESNPYSTLSLEQITVTDTPVTDELNEDYLRIREIAKKSKSSLAERMPHDGIMRSTRGDRFNYVNVPGARSLNMVRAFGNLGNKRFVNDIVVEIDSPIISRPHTKVVKRVPNMKALVIASDGLWDNLEKDTTLDILKQHLHEEWLVNGSRQLEGSVRSCAYDLMNRAVAAKKKPDDVSVIVVPLFGDV